MTTKKIVWKQESKNSCLHAIPVVIPMTVKDFIKNLNQNRDLISLLFGQRKSGVKREYIENTLYTDSKRFDLLLNNEIIQETGHDIIRLNESLSRFFEDFLNIGEQIDTAYIAEEIKRLHEHIGYYFGVENAREKENIWWKSISIWGDGKNSSA